MSTLILSVHLNHWYAFETFHLFTCVLFILMVIVKAIIKANTVLISVYISDPMKFVAKNMKALLVCIGF